MKDIFDVQNMVRLAVEHGLKIILIVLLTVVIAKLVRGSLSRLERKLAVEDSKAGRNLHRSTTLVSVLRSAFSMAIWTVAVFTVLSELDVKVGPLLTAAGVVGVAIGFGAQSLVRDFVTGFFVLLEDQYRVGDTVVIGIIDGVQVAGTVERFSLRSTALREGDGTLHQVPNGVVQVVSNRSAGWSQAILDVSVPYEQDLGRVKDALKEASADLMADESLGRSVTADPEILGVEDLGESRVTVRVVARTMPGKQGEVERALRQNVKETFQKEGLNSGS